MNASEKRSLPLFTLCGFAVAQPVLDLLARHPEFFVTRHALPWEILCLVFALLFVLPLILALAAAAVSRVHEGAGRVFHRALLALFGALILLPIIGAMKSLAASIVIAAALLAGGAFALGFDRWTIVRQLVAVSSVSLLVFPVLFLSNSEIRPLVVPGEKLPPLTARVGRAAPIVMVIFDELPVTALMDESRRIDPMRYPNFADLANRAFWFRNATSAFSETVHAIPMLLTGLYPDAPTTPDAKNYPNSIFSLLAGTYRMNVFEMNTRMCPEEICPRIEMVMPSDPSLRALSLCFDVSVIYAHVVVPEAWRAGLPVISQAWGRFWWPSRSRVIERKRYDTYQDRRAQVEAFIESIDVSRQPTLHLLHVVFPHAPYEYLPSGQRYDGTGVVPGMEMKSETWGNDPWLITQAYQRMLLQVGAADHLLGKLLTRLESVGIDDEALLIVTSDHGVSFMANSSRRRGGPTEKIERDLMPIPLFIKPPRHKGGVMSDRNVEIVDLMPTLVAELAIDGAYAMDGTSVLDWELPERDRKLFFEKRNASRESRAAGRKLRSFRKFELSAQNTAKYETLEWKLARFGAGSDDPKDLFRFGRATSLLGRPIREVPISKQRSTRRVVIDQAPFADVDPQGPDVPARITGHIEGPRAASRSLLLSVAINGRVQGVTRSYRPPQGGRLSFEVMVPADSFQRGPNRVVGHILSRGLHGEWERVGAPGQATGGRPHGETLR